MEAIFSNYKKGNQAKKKDLEKAFGTSDINICAQKIVASAVLKKNKEERKEDNDRHCRQVMNFLHKNYVDAKGRPHPISRLEGVLGQSKVRLDPSKRIQTQAEQIIRSFHGKLVFKKCIFSYQLSMSKKKASKAKKIIYKHCSVRKEKWGSAGCQWDLDVPVSEFDLFTQNLTGVTDGDYQLVRV